MSEIDISSYFNSKVQHPTPVNKTPGREIPYQEIGAFEQTALNVKYKRIGLKQSGWHSSSGPTLWDPVHKKADGITVVQIFYTMHLLMQSFSQGMTKSPFAARLHLWSCRWESLRHVFWSL